MYWTHHLPCSLSLWPNYYKSPSYLGTMKFLEFLDENSLLHAYFKSIPGADHSPLFLAFHALFSFLFFTLELFLCFTVAEFPSPLAHAWFKSIHKRDYSLFSCHYILGNSIFHETELFLCVYITSLFKKTQQLSINHCFHTYAHPWLRIIDTFCS